MMKKIILCFALALITSVALCQKEKVKIIFDVTSSDTEVHKTAVRHVKGMSEAYPESEFEMVIYSGALPMMLKSESSVKTEIESLAKSDNVSLKVCAVSLKKNNATEQDLISGVGTVPDGIIEIVTKQNQGWGYIKEAN
ncbi:DsrE family protein [Marivirga sp.]|uniref:DsrE family protein n=1 Tax=Marivirga sp. TaxID=2018662 RepID=UPI0025D073AF|nr:DsrE family protein [Marivirga sp.]